MNYKLFVFTIGILLSSSCEESTKVQSLEELAKTYIYLNQDRVSQEFRRYGLTYQNFELLKVDLVDSISEAEFILSQADCIQDDFELNQKRNRNHSISTKGIHDLDKMRLLTQEAKLKISSDNIKDHAMLVLKLNVDTQDTLPFILYVDNEQAVYSPMDMISL